MQTARVKISVSLPSELVARIDRAARAQTRSRSRVLEDWLRDASRTVAERELEAATVSYYESLTAEEDQEDAEMAAALSAKARHLRVDGGVAAGTRRRRKP